MTDNTQAEHMNNSSQSTPYAQGSAQVELNEILNVLYMQGEDIGKLEYGSATHQITAVNGAKQAILDWHNKQIEELLDRLESQSRRADDCTDDTLVVKMIRVGAERDRLNSSKSTPFNKIKESK